MVLKSQSYVYKTIFKKGMITDVGLITSVTKNITILDISGSLK